MPSKEKNNTNTPVVDDSSEEPIVEDTLEPEAAEEAVEAVEAPEVDETKEDAVPEDDSVVAEAPAEDANAAPAEEEVATEESANDALQAMEVPKDKKNRNLAITIIIIVVVLLAVIVLIMVNRPDGAWSGFGNSATVAADVVATVGESEITMSMVDRESALILYNDYGQYLDSLTPDEQQIFKNQILVYFLVQAELIKEHLREAGTGTLSEEQMASISTSVDAYFSMIENSEETFASIGVTREDIEYFMELSEYMLIYQAEVIAENPVTDADIEQFYNENKDYFAIPYQISASHILVMDEDHTPEKLAEIEAIRERAIAGEDFAELAKEYSEDPGSAADGGSVGYFGENHNFVPEFGAAALALENIGDISEIVETTYGYHIIMLTDKQEAAAEPLSAVSEQISTYLAELRTSEAALALKDTIEIKYYIDVDPETGEPPLVLPPAEGTEALGVEPETIVQ